MLDKATAAKTPRPAILLTLALLLAFGCADPPAAPMVPPAEPEPEPSAVSIEIDPLTARVVTFTYRLAPPLDRSVDVWTEHTPPTGTPHENEHDFPAGTTTRVFTTGYIPADWVGTWTLRIMGERLPEDVILGEPSSGTWTVLP